MIAEQVLFWLFATLTIISALGVILTRNAVASAMSLVGCFFFLAGIAAAGLALAWALMPETRPEENQGDEA